MYILITATIPAITSLLACNCEATLDLLVPEVKCFGVATEKSTILSRKCLVSIYYRAYSHQDEDHVSHASSNTASSCTDEWKLLVKRIKLCTYNGPPITASVRLVGQQRECGYLRQQFPKSVVWKIVQRGVPVEKACQPACSLYI